MTTTSPRPNDVSVTLPVSQAFDRVKRVLFQPFDLGKWCIIGFCAWLALLGQGGGGGFNFHFPSGRGGSGSLRQGLEEATQFVMSNLGWIIPLVVAGVLVGLILWVAFTWLSSRGQFMFLHCVALDRAEVREPWARFAQPANSLCWFRLVVGLLGTLVTLPLVVLMVVLILGMVKRGEPSAGGILGTVGLGLVLIVAALVLGIIQKLLLDFVVPIMFLRGARCVAAWREFLPLLRANLGRFVLYLLFQIVLGLAIGAALVALVFITCCCAGCLMAIPYLGTVLLLPVLVFSRAYALHYLAQYGPAYDVFPPIPYRSASAPPAA
jgi:hypothetical protein